MRKQEQGGQALKRRFNNFAERTARQEISRICKELQKANKKKEDDTWFEDDPKAVKEKDYGRVYHEPTIQPLRVVIPC
jgi:predicted metal-dependent hydrolase